MKTHEERMHELLYDCEGIVEKSERICKLEELVLELLEHGTFTNFTLWDVGYRLKELDLLDEFGIEVES